MTDTLSPERVAEIRARVGGHIPQFVAGGVVTAVLYSDVVPVLQDRRALLVSHEALRAEVERAKDERETALQQLDWQRRRANDAVANAVDYAKQLNAARAALSAARPDEWQPIETAPKDGTRFLAWMPWFDGPCAVELWWEDGAWQMRDRKFTMGCRATHWHPMPPPPALRRPAGEEG